MGLKVLCNQSAWSKRGQILVLSENMQHDLPHRKAKCQLLVVATSLACGGRLCNSIRESLCPVYDGEYVTLLVQQWVLAAMVMV